MRSVQLFFAAALAGLASAHMRLVSPPPLRGVENPNTKSPDYEMTTPLSTSGSNYPCRGALSVMGTPEGAPVADWPAGSQQSFTIGGGASHAGGSCQASLSEDGGQSFKVVRSYVGGCPVEGKQFTFTVPADMKPGLAIFSWTWFNKIGNREMYMNCAAVTITGAGGPGLSNYPDVFKANIGNGCSTTEGSDLAFPDPGNDVEENSTKTGPPVGACGSGPSGPGAGAGSGSPGGSGSSVSSAPTPKPSATGYGTPGSSSYGWGPSAPPANNPKTTTTTTTNPAAPSGAGSSSPTTTTSKARGAPSDAARDPEDSTQMYVPTMSTSSPAFTSTTKPGCKCECNGRTFSIVQY